MMNFENLPGQDNIWKSSRYCYLVYFFCNNIEICFDRPGNAANVTAVIRHDARSTLQFFDFSSPCNITVNHVAAIELNHLNPYRHCSVMSALLRL